MFTRIVLVVVAALLIIGGATTIVLGVTTSSDEVTCDGQPMTPADHCRVEAPNGGIVDRDLGQQADAQQLMPTIAPWLGAMAVLGGLVLLGALVADGVRRAAGSRGPGLLGGDLPKDDRSEQWWEIQHDQQRRGPWGRRPGSGGTSGDDQLPPG